MDYFVEKNSSVILGMKEEIAKQGAVMVNRLQCAEMVGELDALSGTLVKYSATMTIFHSLLLKEIYRIATIADIVVGECCGRDSASTWGEIWWIEAAVRQLDNDSAFKRIVRELKFCTNILAEVLGDHLISDVFRRLASKMRPPTKTSFFNDHEQLLSRLRGVQASDLNCRRKEKLVQFLKHRVDCVVRRAKPGNDNARRSSSSSLPSLRRKCSVNHARSFMPSLRRARSSEDARPSASRRGVDEAVTLSSPPVSETYSYIVDDCLFNDAQIIGHGVEGYVDKVKWGGIVCARKSSRTSEGNIVASLRHFNVVKHFFQLQYSEDESPVIIMELMEMSLVKFIKRQYKRTDGWAAQSSLLAKIDILLQMCYGMKYIHKLGVLHLDIKPGNILVNPCVIPEFMEDGYARVKIADFGSARVPVFTSSSVDNDFNLPGTTVYRAPEVTGACNANESPSLCFPQQGGRTPFRVSRRADVFSFALTSAEVLSGVQPYTGVKQNEIHYRKTKRNERPKLPPSLPQELKALLVECWSENPKARPPFKEIITRLRRLKARLLTQSCAPGGTHLHLDSPVSPAPLARSIRCKASMAALVQSVSNDFNRRLPYKSLPHYFPTQYSHGGNKKFVYKDIKLKKKLKKAKELGSRHGEQADKGCKYGDTHEADVKDVSTGAIRSYAVRKIPTTVQDLGALWQMSRIDHPNIAKLLGWCTNGENLLLVYDWVERRDLRTNLQDIVESPHLTWRVRQKILIDVASALRHLHEDCGLVHHRVKATNVLLRNDRTAILRDGGLALLVPQNPRKWDNDLRKLRHHLAPELPWYKEHTKASDVFAFGILLLEVVCGRRPDSLNDDGKYLADWVWHAFSDCHSNGSLVQWVERVVHSSLFNDYDVREVSVALCLGLLCCHPDMNARPTMGRVERVLVEGACLLDNLYHEVPSEKPLVRYGSATHIDDELLPPRL